MNEHIRRVLKVLSEEFTTPYTIQEVWTRVHAIGWRECLPTLIAELQSDDPSVVRLTLNVLRETAEKCGCPHPLSGAFSAIEKCVGHEDRLVRQAAIHVLGAARCNHKKIVETLQHVVTNDEPYLATEAAAALLQICPDETDLSFLIGQLYSSDQMVVTVAAEGVGRLRKRAASAVPRLKELLNVPTAQVAAALAILRITGDSTDAREIAWKYRKSQDWTECEAGEELLQEIDRIFNTGTYR